MPWWNADVKQAITEKRVSNFDNLIAYKRLRSAARRTIMAAKKSSWEKIIFGIDPSSSEGLEAGAGNHWFIGLQAFDRP